MQSINAKTERTPNEKPRHANTHAHYLYTAHAQKKERERTTKKGRKKLERKKKHPRKKTRSAERKRNGRLQPYDM